MRLNVSPNRMELLRLRRRLALARRGHKLLQDKLEQMMYQFLSLIKETRALSAEVNKEIKQVFLQLVISRGLMREEDFHQAIKMARIELDFQSVPAKMMNVPVPKFSFKEPALNLNYEFFRVSPQLDVALNEFRDLLPSLVRLGGLFKSCQLLSFDIERTRRRVNALQYLLIPSISETIRSITDKLNEFERGNLLRLMRIKEVMR